jgi:predicted AAA+ superfamily ATPase
LVVVDEAQLVPSIFDAIQTLYDNDKQRWRFVVCGSSARKLRQTGINLLPGRSIMHRLYPLTISERPAPDGFENGKILPLPMDSSTTDLFPTADLHERLAYGDLPGIVLAAEADRAMVLKSFAMIHLEEEIRREATIRDWGAFINFIRLAAIHSGEMVNYSSLSRETGVSITAIKSHYQLLEDIFIGFSVPGFSGSSRKSLLSTPRFYFSDLGLRHAAAGLEPGRAIVDVNPGSWFEQWVGIELWKRLHYLGIGKLSYLRTKTGMEIDYIVETGSAIIPVEVKWTENPTISDARHLRSFISETPAAKTGFIVCRCPRPQALTENIMALPWWMI